MSITAILQQLEAEMRRLELWQTVAPTAEQLASEQPFAYDTLTLPQWMQWILIPRLRAVLQANGQLPAQSDIHTYAVQYFREADMDTDSLLNLVKDLDEALGGPPDKPAPDL